MSLIVTLAGQEAALRALVAGATLRLYVNDYTPSVGATGRNFIELTGYQPLPLTLSEWVFAAGQLVYPEQVFTFVGVMVEVYGYYLHLASGAVPLAERFIDGPYRIRNVGDEIRIVLTVEGSAR